MCTKLGTRQRIFLPCAARETHGKNKNTRQSIFAVCQIYNTRQTSQSWYLSSPVSSHRPRAAHNPHPTRRPPPLPPLRHAPLTSPPAARPSLPPAQPKRRCSLPPARLMRRSSLPPARHRRRLPSLHTLLLLPLSSPLRLPLLCLRGAAACGARCGGDSSGGLGAVEGGHGTAVT